MNGPPKSYCSYLDNALLDKEKADKSKFTYYPLRPSAAGYCGRKLAFDTAAFHGLFDKLEETRDARILRLLNLGNGIEFHVLRLLEQIPDFKVKFKQQVVSLFTLDSGRLIEGSVDAVMWSDKFKGVLDVKSVGNGWHQAFKSRWDSYHDRYKGMSSCREFDENGYYVEDLPSFLDELGEDALVANCLQINLYTCSQFMQERGVDHGIVMRYCKNDSAHMEIRFKPSMELFEMTRQKFNAIEQAALAGKPETVDKDFNLGSQACAYCPYQANCWPEATAKKAYYRTLPGKRWAKKLSEIPDSTNLAKYLSEYSKLVPKIGTLDRTEQVIIKEMQRLQVEKVKTESGVVYELQFYKSPKPHYELKRTKE